MSALHALLGLLYLLASCAAAAAQPAPSAAGPESTLPGTPESRSSTPGGETGVKPGEQASSSLWGRANLLPDPGGARAALVARGVTFSLSETSEVFGNVAGGTRQGLVYEGLTQFGLGLDTEKAFGLSGGTLNVTGLQIHGRGLSLNNLDNNLNTVSSLEAQRGTLLFELWYEQALFDKKLQIRVGQLAADQEFMVSQYASLFLNHTFGWPTLPSTDLPSGGPAYPLATPGVRLRWVPRTDLTFLAAVLNGDPAGPGPGTPQDRDPSGTAFRLNDGVLVIGEAQYAVNQGDGATGLPGTYKFGFWYLDAVTNDERRAGSGALLATLPANTMGRTRRGDWSLYAVADQLLWRPAGTSDGGIGMFTRLMGAPGDRNLVNVYADAGVTWKGLIPGRDADTAGLGAGYARISDTAAQRDSDAALLSPGMPIRRSETVLELTYQAQIAPWWQVQPSAQYVFDLNGGVRNPANPQRRLGDAAVFGLRTLVTF